MRFIQTAGRQDGVKALSDRLKKELKRHTRVLWLISGGSNIEASVEIMAGLPDKLTQKLAIFLADERFGETGHTHSNAKQLMDAGFQQKQAIFVPILSPGFTMEETKERYAQALERGFEHADIVVAQLGIGPDGHIAGILPHSPAVEADTFVTAYETPQYNRVSMTFRAMRHITAAYALAYGENKKLTLTALRDQQLPLEDQPAQILKELPEAFIYNDQIGEKS